MPEISADGRPALAAAGSGATGETLVDGRPALSTSGSGLRAEASVAPKPAVRQSEPRAPEASPEEPDTEIEALKSNLNHAVVDLTKPLPGSSQKRKPQRSEFSDPDSWEEAVTTWAAGQATQLLMRDGEANRRHAAVATALRALNDKTRNAALERYPDFEQVAEADSLKISEPMAAAILGLGHVGRDVQHHLGKHPAEAERIAALNLVEQAAEIGKIAARLDQKKPVARARTAAPRTSGGEESMDAYAARRLPELRKSLWAR